MPNIVVAATAVIDWNEEITSQYTACHFDNSDEL